MWLTVMAPDDVNVVVKSRLVFKHHDMKVQESVEQRLVFSTSLSGEVHGPGGNEWGFKITENKSVTFRNQYNHIHTGLYFPISVCY